MLTTTEVLNAMYQGHFSPADLQLIAKVATQKYKQAVTHQFRQGQRVQFVHNGCSVVGRIKSVNDKTCTVMDCGTTREPHQAVFPYGVRVPFSLLTVVD